MIIESLYNHFEEFISKIEHVNYHRVGNRWLICAPYKLKFIGDRLTPEDWELEINISDSGIILYENRGSGQLFDLNDPSCLKKIENIINRCMENV